MSDTSAAAAPAPGRQPHSNSQTSSTPHPQNPLNRPRQCRYIKTSGEQCRANALKGNHYCHCHKLNRKPTFAGVRGYDRVAFLEDTASVVLSVSQIMQGLLEGAVEPRIATAAFYGGSVALSAARLNFARERWLHHTSQSLPEQVAETVREDGDELAPDREYKGPDQVHQPQWSFSKYRYEQECERLGKPKPTCDADYPPSGWLTEAELEEQKTDPKAMCERYDARIRELEKEKAARDAQETAEALAAGRPDPHAKPLIDKDICPFSIDWCHGPYHDHHCGYCDGEFAMELDDQRLPAAAVLAEMKKRFWNNCDPPPLPPACDSEQVRADAERNLADTEQTYRQAVAAAQPNFTTANQPSSTTTAQPNATTNLPTGPGVACPEQAPKQSESRAEWVDFSGFDLDDLQACTDQPQTRAPHVPAVGDMGTHAARRRCRRKVRKSPTLTHRPERGTPSDERPTGGLRPVPCGLFGTRNAERRTPSAALCPVPCATHYQTTPTKHTTCQTHPRGEGGHAARNRSFTAQENNQDRWRTPPDPSIAAQSQSVSRPLCPAFSASCETAPTAAHERSLPSLRSPKAAYAVAVPRPLRLPAPHCVRPTDPRSSPAASARLPRHSCLR